MVTRKTLIVVGVIVLLIIFGYALYLFFGGNQRSAGPRPGGLLPVSPPAGVTVPTGETILVPAKEGSVEVRNFYKEAVVINRNGDALIKDVFEYSFSYISHSNSFSISILNPTRSTRDTIDKAERDFLRTLNISKSQACQLSVSIVFPASANVEEYYYEQTLAPSFCPGGNPLR